MTSSTLEFEKELSIKMFLTPYLSYTQPAFTCSKSTMETTEQYVISG